MVIAKCFSGLPIFWNGTLKSFYAFLIFWNGILKCFGDIPFFRNGIKKNYHQPSKCEMIDGNAYITTYSSSIPENLQTTIKPKLFLFQQWSVLVK